VRVLCAVLIEQRERQRKLAIVQSTLCLGQKLELPGECSTRLR
jgi:hypothetical protein